jgi:hypothetical protein
VPKMLSWILFFGYRLHLLAVPGRTDNGRIRDNVRSKLLTRPFVNKLFTNVYRCQPCPVNFFQTPGNACEACRFGFHTRLSASVVCEPCPLGTVGHHLGGCRACSPGTFGGGQSNNCSICTAGTYSGYGYPSCIPCKQGEYSNGAGSAECRICVAGSFSKKQSSFCSPCSINTASNLSMQHACLDCLSGNVAPLPGMTTCFPCPAQHNASSWILLVPHKLRTNASEATLQLAAVIVHESCFRTAGKVRNELLTDTITASSATVIAIISTVAVIILILAAYFLKTQCKVKTKTECSKQHGKEVDTSVPISEMPDNIRTDMMVKLGGQYFYQLIQRRRKVSETLPSDIELCGIGSSSVEAPVDSCLPQISALITVQIAPTDEPDGTDDIIDEDEPSEQGVSLDRHQNELEERKHSCLRSASLIGIPLAPFKQPGIDDHSETGHLPAYQLELERDPKEHKNVLTEPLENPTFAAGVFLEPSDELDKHQNLSAEPQTYQGKKYSIDLESVRCLLCAVN